MCLISCYVVVFLANILFCVEQLAALSAWKQQLFLYVVAIWLSLKFYLFMESISMMLRYHVSMCIYVLSVFLATISGISKYANTAF